VVHFELKNAKKSAAGDSNLENFSVKKLAVNRSVDAIKKSVN